MIRKTKYKMTVHIHKNSLLIINSGSSSIKFALYETGEELSVLSYGSIENIGTPDAIFSFNSPHNSQKDSCRINAANHNYAAGYLVDCLENQEGFISVKAIGHRIVHGMEHTEPEAITAELLNELKAIGAYDPDHLPNEINLIETFSNRYPEMLQVACFDTAFHASMPQVAQLLPVPRRYNAMGIRRYGFHGLSYTYLMEELKRQAGSEIAHGKIILAHLGSGASLAAVKNGKSIDTSMGFTPASGLPMGTRTGDLDPGAAWYLMQFEKLNAQQFNHLINHESGLLGVSETSADMHNLLQVENTDTRAAEAVELFCYQTRKWIGSFTAVLGVLDTLVFSGGIGERSAEIRERICCNLQFLGIELDADENAAHKPIISAKASKVCVRVIPTNEELIMAQMVGKVLNHAV